jgi:hypothetical protein
VAASPLTTGATQSWTIRLTERDDSVIADAHVSVDAWQPETEQRSPIHPNARYVGGGNYRVDDLAFTRSGWWNVALVIDGRAGVDSVAFNVVLPGRD